MILQNMIFPQHTHINLNEFDISSFWAFKKKQHIKILVIQLGTDSPSNYYDIDQEVIIIITKYLLMEKQDELLKYFAEEEKQSFRKFSSRLSIQQFKDLGENILKEQYQQLNSSKALRNREERQTHSIPDIGGTRMRSIVDNEIYGIFCQAPYQSTSSGFWQACYQSKVTKIFMLLAESQKYWPEMGQTINFQLKQIRITCTKAQKYRDNLERRYITMSGKQGDHLVEHIHFKRWIDGRVPEGEEDCQLFRQLVAEAAEAIENKSGILIHCRAGIGRIGTFGATIEGLRSASKLNSISLFQIVGNMRIYRKYCVETFAQYRFIHTQLSRLL